MSRESALTLVRERIYFRQRAVLVTHRRLVTLTRTVPIRRVEGVKTISIAPERRPAVACLVVGCAALLVVPALGCAVAGIGMVWLFALRPSYGLVVRTSVGEFQVLRSREARFIQLVSAAINEAIAENWWIASGEIRPAA